MVSLDSRVLPGRKGEAFAPTKEERVVAEVRHSVAELQHILRRPFHLIHLGEGRVAALDAQNDEQQLAGARHHLRPAHAVVALAAAASEHGLADVHEPDARRRRRRRREADVADDEDPPPVHVVYPPPVERDGLDPRGASLGQDAPGGVPRPPPEGLLRPLVAIELGRDRHPVRRWRRERVSGEETWTRSPRGGSRSSAPEAGSHSTSRVGDRALSPRASQPRDAPKQYGIPAGGSRISTSC